MANIMKSINETQHVPEVLISLMNGAKFLLKENNGFIDVVNEKHERIGSARLYSSGHGYAIHTKNYGGFAGLDEIQFIN